MIVPLVAALCDLGYSIYQRVSEGEDKVAYFQYMSPAVVAVSMVSLYSNMYIHRVVSIVITYC